jgi:DNA-binding XRE family transcriptional regulator
VEDLKQILAKNITALRQANHMTQLELAEKLNYSDKAISKWERGESIPDVTVLKAIADLFGVSLDYLVEEDHAAHQPEATPVQEIPGRKLRNHKVVTTLSILIVWFVATFLFVVLDAAIPQNLATWLTFAYAVPVTMIVWLVFNSIWFNRRRNYLIISLLMWTVLAAVFLSVLAGGYLLWKLFFLGIPGQIAILVWSRFQRKKS